MSVGLNLYLATMNRLGTSGNSAYQVETLEKEVENARKEVEALETKLLAAKERVGYDSILGDGSGGGGGGGMEQSRSRRQPAFRVATSMDTLNEGVSAE